MVQVAGLEPTVFRFVFWYASNYTTPANKNELIQERAAITPTESNVYTISWALSSIVLVPPAFWIEQFLSCRLAESTGLEPAQGYNTLEGLAIPCDTITPTLHSSYRILSFNTVSRPSKVSVLIGPQIWAWNVYTHPRFNTAEQLIVTLSTCEPSIVYLPVEFEPLTVAIDNFINDHCRNYHKTVFGASDGTWTCKNMGLDHTPMPIRLQRHNVGAPHRPTKLVSDYRLSALIRIFY